MSTQTTVGSHSIAQTIANRAAINLAGPEGKSQRRSLGDALLVVTALAIEDSCPH